VDRRRFLRAGLSLTGIAYTCSSAAAARASGRTTTDTPPVVVRETGMPNWPLFEWEQPGGVFGRGEGVFEPPPLAVYGDNSAYADADARLVVPQVWVSTLHDHALEILSNTADLARDPEKPPPRDRPWERIRARSPAGDYLTARVEGWQDGDPQHAYPPQLRELWQHVQGVRRHVRKAGLLWRPAGVLLAVVTLEHRPAHFTRWPQALPLPDREVYQEIRLPNGAAGLPQATGPVWPRYRVGRTHFVAATWRSLLPHEIT
jgi:hypothetical protein